MFMSEAISFKSVLGMGGGGRGSGAPVTETAGLIEARGGLIYAGQPGAGSEPLLEGRNPRGTDDSSPPYEIHVSGWRGA